MLLVKSRESKSLDKKLFKSAGCFAALLASPNVARAQETASITNPSQILSTFLSLLVVVGIIFALAYIMRRINGTHSSSGQLNVVATLSTGAKERIMVLQVGGEQHLIGVTGHTISHLTTLKEPITTSAPTSGEQFKDKLVSAMAGKLNPKLKESGNDQ